MQRPSGAAPPPRSVVSSSPGRPEKLPTAPAGLAQFLVRGKSWRNRRSSGNNRSSPMFVSRNRSIKPSASSPAEPSSPKVTCIGQVRIRAKKKKITMSKGPAASKRSSEMDQYRHQQQQTQLPTMRCRCLERPLLCKFFTMKPAAERPPRWRRRLSHWFKIRSSKGSSIHQTQREEDRDGEAVTAAPREYSISSEFDDEDEEEVEEELEAETRVFMTVATSTPPKNALLLMRCRSAPHNRSSALATCRFTVSPVVQVGQAKSPAGDEPEEEEDRGSCTDGGGGGEEEAVVGRPAILTRCKSEPARTAAAKLVVPAAAASAEGVCSWNGSGRPSSPNHPLPSSS